MKRRIDELKGLVAWKQTVPPGEAGCNQVVLSPKIANTHGITSTFTQHSRSFASVGVVCGLYFQNPSPQGRVISCVHGGVYEVVVDLRQDSPTFGDHAAFLLEGYYDSREMDENLIAHVHQIYIPPGFAHGYMALSGKTIVDCLSTVEDVPDYQHTIAFNDPTLGISWPTWEWARWSLSDKDRQGSTLSEFPKHLLF